MNAGAALYYAIEIISGQMRDVNFHKDAVLLVTDTPSDDEVLTPAKILRDIGVLVS